MNIKNNLQKYRNWKNINQKDLAKVLGISVNQLRKIEIYNEYPEYQVRYKMCKYFDINQDQMFYLEDEK